MTMEMVNDAKTPHCKNRGVKITPWCHSDGCRDYTSVLQGHPRVSKLSTTMNTDTYLQGYIYKLKTLHIRFDEVGKSMLSNKLYMYIHIQDIP